MINGRDFVFTGLQPWDIAIGSNARDMAIEVSKHNRVLYVNTPLSKNVNCRKSTNPDQAHRIKVLRGEEPVLRQLNRNLWVLDCPFMAWPINSLPDGWLFDMCNRINNRKMFAYVREMMKKLGFADIIHFIDNDIYRSFYAKEYLPSALTIYYRRDNILSIDFWKRHACRLEPQLIAKCDLVACNSAYLAQGAQRYNKQSYDIGQGVDLTPYSADVYPTFEDINRLARPVIGYLGHITSVRLDADLIYSLAVQNPTRSFALVGSTDALFEGHALHTLENVHFLGQKPQVLVPAYIAAFDICINPQVVNDVTIGNYPRKIDEYLAMGKSVVATRTSAMQMFEQYVYLCDSAQEYQAAFDAILGGERKSLVAESVAFAHTHTWGNSAGRLYDLINAKLK